MSSSLTQLTMPKGIPKAGKRVRKTKPMVDCTIKLPLEVKQSLTTQEKRIVLMDAHNEKMRDLSAWCDRMLNKLK